jgi:hypothetical protein
VSKNLLFIKTGCHHVNTSDGLALHHVFYIQPQSGAFSDDYLPIGLSIGPEKAIIESHRTKAEPPPNNRFQ